MEHAYTRALVPYTTHTCYQLLHTQNTSIPTRYKAKKKKDIPKIRKIFIPGTGINTGVECVEERAGEEEGSDGGVEIEDKNWKRAADVGSEELEEERRVEIVVGRRRRRRWWKHIVFILMTVRHLFCKNCTF